MKAPSGPRFPSSSSLSSINVLLSILPRAHNSYARKRPLYFFFSLTLLTPPPICHADPAHPARLLAAPQPPSDASATTDERPCCPFRFAAAPSRHSCGILSPA
ncbi:hypothetical protein GY45DRAFT_172539 [Cubamyces sp. BRFM 1775]|nr:hypothetical protein GY45DRAFT_172539 [Cubamyces sp. BRFM 1775]